MSKIGTKETMRGWLQDHKHLTYSAYSELPTEKKLAIQSEYQKKGASKKG